MAYNPEKAEQKIGFPADSVLQGYIIEIKDGTAKDFLKKTEKWEGSLDSPAINAIVEIMQDGRAFRIEHLFTYESKDGKTLFSQRSNIGKFYRKYGSLPKVGMPVKCQTDKDGYAKIKLD